MRSEKQIANNQTTKISGIETGELKILFLMQIYILSVFKKTATIIIIMCKYTLMVYSSYSLHLSFNILLAHVNVVLKRRTNNYLHGQDRTHSLLLGVNTYLMVLKRNNNPTLITY